ncbi:MAG: hypothetical protein CVU89_05085 [Firmicutes bacterium HGW-Firmicutes-14]|nr:MAG: hypothetical protein CVU89_05085 [Firmicutes bacterium HGW-Firmicutes-14]
MSKPDILFIEINNTCNLSCAMCPRSTLKRPMQFMSFGLFKKIVNEAADLGVPQVRLFLFGEPLLHPDLVTMINYAKDKGIKFIDFNTNGTLLSNEIARKLVSSKLDSITFSVTGFTQETYNMFQGYKTGFSLGEIEKNIENFILERNNQNKDKPELNMQFIVTKDSIRDVLPYYEKWGLQAGSVYFTKLNTYKGKFGRQIKGKRLVCPEIAYKLVVLADGDVTVCCQDYNGALAVGNINTSSLYDLWNRNPKLDEFRKLHRKQDFSQLPLCRDCDVLFMHGNGLSREVLGKVMRLISKVEMRDQKPSIVLFGANNVSQEILDNPGISNYIRCVVDNNKFGEVLGGKDVCHPSILNEINFDLVVINSVKYAREIYEQVKHFEDKGKEIWMIAKQ